MQSLRRSLRESFRQRRNTGGAYVGANNRRKVTESLNLDTEKLSYNKKESSRNPRLKANSEPTSPVMNNAGNEVQVNNEYVCITHMYVCMYVRRLEIN